MRQSRIRLITHGDDCGSNHTANIAILDAFKNGMFTDPRIVTYCREHGVLAIRYDEAL